jgi:hypothetical protein
VKRLGWRPAHHDPHLTGVAHTPHGARPLRDHLDLVEKKIGRPPASIGLTVVDGQNRHYLSASEGQTTALTDTGKGTVLDRGQLEGSPLGGPEAITSKIRGARFASPVAAHPFDHPSTLDAHL